MNDKDRDELTELKVEVRNNTKQLENLITNHIPHIMKDIGYCIGSLKVLIPLVILLLGLIAGLYFL